MGIERILTTTASGALLGGMSWRPTGGGRHSTRRLHEARNLVADATHYSLLSTDGTAVYGLFQPRASEESLRLPKGTLSAAHCFAAKVGPLAPNAALVLTVPDDGQRKAQQVYVVVLDDGVPVIDALTSDMEARNALGSEDRPLWSNDPYAFPLAQAADFDFLVEGVGKASRVLPIPFNPWPLVAVTVLVAASVGGWQVLNLQRQKMAEDTLQRQIQAQDPVPRYLAGLAAATEQMSTDRAQLLDAVGAMFDLPVVVPGWRMQSVECVAVNQRCVTTWARLGGTYDELKQARPSEELQLITPNGSPVPSFETAQTVKRYEFRRQRLSVPAAQLAPVGVAMKEAGGLLQVWRTASLAIEFKPPSLWPNVPAVPPGLAHPSALVAGQVTLSEVPGPFIVEALREAPSWISWEAVRADIADGDPASRLKFKAFGNYYASRS